MKQLKRSAKAFLAVLICLLLLPVVPAGAAEADLRWELEMIRAEFPARIGIRGEGIRVAVIDSGVSPLPCFAALEPGKDYTGAGSTEDALGHGTFIAGILASSGADGAIAGVAPEVTLIPMRCFSSSSGELEWVVSAIYDAVDEFQCRVVSLSFGQKEDAPELRSAVSYALSQGVVVVAAAGNSGAETLQYPAAYEGVIAVSAVDRSAEIAQDAQHNASVAISAPGVKVTGPSPEGGQIVRSGSSFAVPFVAGAAALLLNADESLTPAQVRQTLCSTAADKGKPGWDPYYGWGILDVEAALRSVLSARYASWLSPPEAIPGGVQVLACAPGGKPVEGVCRLGQQSLPLSLEPGEEVFLRFAPQTEAASCAVWRPDASGGEVCISNVREWAGALPEFSDVPADAWFAGAVTAAAATGLMLGYDDGRFGVGESLKLSEALAIACRLHNLHYGGSGVFDQIGDGPWYQVYADYAEKYGILEAEQYDLIAEASRRQFAEIISAALPDEALTPINEVTALPDVDADDPALPAILRLYNAGILTGVDEYGAFLPEEAISREQIAAIVARVEDPALRKRFTLKFR